MIPLLIALISPDWFWWIWLGNLLFIVLLVTVGKLVKAAQFA